MYCDNLKHGSTILTNPAFMWTHLGRSGVGAFYWSTSIKNEHGLLDYNKEAAAQCTAAISNGFYLLIYQADIKGFRALALSA